MKGDAAIGPSEKVPRSPLPQIPFAFSSLSHDKFGENVRENPTRRVSLFYRGRKERGPPKVEKKSFDFFSFASILLFRRDPGGTGFLLVRKEGIEDSCLNYSAWTWLKKQGHTLVRSGKEVRMRTMRGIEWGSKEGRVRHNHTRTNDTVDKLITRNSGTPDSRIALFR